MADSPSETQNKLMAAIGSTHWHQAHVASLYAEGMRECFRTGPDDPSQVEWAVVNAAIISRWSATGLNNVKRLAWAQVEAHRG
jgi:hypothetical protein